MPVPDVLGTGHLGDPPYFLAERVPGANPTCDREGCDARRRCRLFGARLRLTVNFGAEMAGRPASAADARAREHREALQARFGDRLYI